MEQIDVTLILMCSECKDDEILALHQMIRKTNIYLNLYSTGALSCKHYITNGVLFWRSCNQQNMLKLWILWLWFNGKWQWPLPILKMRWNVKQQLEAIAWPCAIDGCKREKLTENIFTALASKTKNDRNLKVKKTVKWQLEPFQVVVGGMESKARGSLSYLQRQWTALQRIFWTSSKLGLPNICNVTRQTSWRNLNSKSFHAAGSLSSLAMVLNRVIVVQLSISSLVGIVAMLVYFPSFQFSYSDAVQPET